jgi:penicillin-binding protein 1B
VLRINDGGSGRLVPATGEPRRIATAPPTHLVTSMMRSVIDEGTGAGARAAGFALDAAGKSGTTNDLRDAWFVGFTPELLTVVWVGHDDNQALGLSGSQAALPIWTDFMQRALAGHANVPFPEPPDGVVPIEIDRDTGMLAGPGCPRVITEVVLAGTEPTAVCELHRYF